MAPGLPKRRLRRLPGRPSPPHAEILAIDEVKAWLDGDWTAVEGAFFDCWSTANIVPPFKIPEDWIALSSGDWGNPSPFRSAGGWLCRMITSYPMAERCLVERLFVIASGMGSMDPASGCRGLKSTAEEVGTGLMEREKERLFSLRESPKEPQ
jgi:hypothetical protein